MIPIIDFQRRAETGPVMEEQQFDLAFAKKVREVVARYSIKWNPEELIADDATADAVFKAGVDLLAELGVFHRETKRVLQYSKEEAEQIAKDAWNSPRTQTFGKGKDEFTIKYRTAEDPTPIVKLMGPVGIVATEEYYIPYMQSFMQEELAAGCSYSGILNSYQGVSNKVNTIGEVTCAMAEVKLTLEAARRVGRPDIFINFGSAISIGANLAPVFPGGREAHNSMFSVHIMPDQKVDWTRLTLAKVLEERGLVPWVSASAVMGAMCRGPEDAAVAMIANLLGQQGYGHSSIASLGSSDISGRGSDLNAFWAMSAAARACERNIGLPLNSGINAVAGAGTEMGMYEKAAGVVARVASGCSWLWSDGARTGKAPYCVTALEGRLDAEIALAVAGMKMADANQLVKKIHAKYVDNLKSAPVGETFLELYDLKKIQPKESYLDLYKKVKDELAKLGVPFK